MAKVDFNGEGQELERITAKKNYASSMQSHKMGSCAMFNELHKYMGENFYPDLINEVDGNYAVEQYPVLAFQDVKLEDTSDYEQRYIGLYTVGADKGDKGYFGFNDPRVKDKAIRLEGTDHIKGVGFNYPWRVNGVRNIRYNHDKEALCIVTGEDKTKWTAILEQSHCGTAETEAEIEAYLEEKFIPIYELAYNNNPLLVGTSMSIETINADVDAFGSLRRTDGRPYSYCEFWIDGEYDVYYLNQERNRYEKNGLNLYNVLSDEDKARVDAASTLDEKNEIFIKHRVNAFKEVAENYICIDDALFLIVFCLVVVASDNFEKNMYPYIMDFLLRFFNDDLDSIFSTDNQAQDTKKYSAELHDFTDDTMSAYVFKGEDNALFNLIEMAYPDRLMKMGKDMLQSMYDLSKKGTKTLDRLNGYYDQTFFDKAQEYFPISAYNNDSEVSYLEAWNDKDYVASVDIHPLAQSLGNHYTTEKRFVNLRNVYLMSKFGFGGFSSYEDNSLGVISVRTQKPVGFTLTPAIDMYPTILGGQAQVSKSERRIKAGESVTLAAVGGGNTNVYIVAADYLTDIGDLKDLSIDPSSDVSLNVSSKRLRWLKLGDEDAAAVTSYLSGVNIQNCDSLEIIDSRNLVSLKGDVDLTNCPRLYAALFKGTSTKKINIPVGSKIEILTLPDTVTTLVLNKLQNLTEEGLDFGTLGQLAYLRLESNKKLDGWELMKTAQQNSDQLTHIRVIGFYKVGDSNDLNLIMQLTNGEYHGIDAEGNADNEGYPVIEGHLHIAGSTAQENIDFLKGKFPALVLTADQIVNYFEFADPEVSRIVAENWGDGTGTSLEQIQAITDIGTVFRENTSIQTFDEFDKFTGVSRIHGKVFFNCNNLESVKIPLTVTYIGTTRNGTYTTNGAFSGCSRLVKIEGLDNLQTLEVYSFARCSSLTEVSLPKVTFIGMSCFRECTSLLKVGIPNVQMIESDAFNGCTSLKIDDLSLPNLETIGQSAFNGVSIKKISNLGKITKVDSTHSSTQGTLGRKDTLISVVFPETLRTLGNSTLYGASNLTECILNEGLNEISDNVFLNCISLPDIIIPSTVTSIGTNTFKGCTGLEFMVFKPLTPPSLNSTSLSNTNNCPIYVPDASVEAYKSATNWNAYAPRIQSIFYYLGYIDFADPAVRDICVANFDTDGDGVVSMEEAAAVTDIGTLFQANTQVQTFNEFKHFTGMTELTARAFKNSSIKEITLPRTITSFKIVNWESPFQGSQLEKIVFPTDSVITDIVGYSFKNTSKLTTITFPDSVKTYGGGVFEGSSVVEVNLSKNTEFIERGFQTNSKIEYINISDDAINYRSINGILYSADGKILERYPKKSKVSFNDAIAGVTGIGYAAFNKVSELTGKIVIPEGVTTIGQNAFSETEITEVVLPSTITSIDVSDWDGSSFTRCKKLSTLIIKTSNVLTMGGQGLFDTPIHNGNGVVYVLDELVDSYKAASGWSTYASQIKPLSEYVEE